MWAKTVQVKPARRREDFDAVYYYYYNFITSSSGPRSILLHRGMCDNVLIYIPQYTERGNTTMCKQMVYLYHIRGMVRIGSARPSVWDQCFIFAGDYVFKWTHCVYVSHVIKRSWWNRPRHPSYSIPAVIAIFTKIQTFDFLPGTVFVHAILREMVRTWMRVMTWKRNRSRQTPGRHDGLSMI